MATDRKHIAVYLHPLVEQALTTFCEDRGLKSKKGFMYSAGVNAVLAEFFGIDIDSSNLEIRLSSQTLAAISNIRTLRNGLRVTRCTIPVQESFHSGVSSVSNIRSPMSNNSSLETLQAGVSSVTNIGLAMSNDPALQALQSGVSSVSDIRSVKRNIPVEALQSGANAATNIGSSMSNNSSLEALQAGVSSVSNIRLARSSIPALEALQSDASAATNIGSARSNDLALQSFQAGVSSVFVPNPRKLGSSIPSNLCASDVSNLLPESIAVDVLPEKSSLGDVEADLLRQQLQAVLAQNQQLQNDLSSSESQKESIQQELLQVRSQLEQERADRNEIEAELSELKQNSALVATPSKKLTPDLPQVLSQIRAKRKKLRIELGDLKAILKILESPSNQIEEE